MGKLNNTKKHEKTPKKHEKRLKNDQKQPKNDQKQLKNDKKQGKKHRKSLKNTLNQAVFSSKKDHQKTPKTDKNSTFFYKYKVSTNFLQEITT